MDWLSTSTVRVERDAPLGRLTWYRLGGSARWLAHPADERELSDLLGQASRERVPVKVLGGGANVLVSDDGFDGLVVRLDEPFFRSVSVEGTAVRVGAGVDLMTLCRTMSERGLSGLEGLAGIPGTVGGAVRMNAGGRYGSFGDVVRSVRVMHRDATVQTWPRERVGFGYRHSLLGDAIVLSAELELATCDPASAKEAHRLLFDQKMSSQPMAEHSAGCVFKNPPQAPAGQLIDQAGLKGVSFGRAMVSAKHANFIVADRGATAADVLGLIELIRQTVRERWGTELEVEIDIW